jgi:hypothetical protein
MTINSKDLVDRIASHAMKTGLFDRVNQHEPKSKPGRGLTCAVWIDRIEPARSRSGLDATDARVVFNVRVYTNMLQQPQDAIDPNVMDAMDKLFTAYTGDFQLGSNSRFIDVLGMTQGHPLFCQSGYINIDNMVFRVLTATVPVIVERAWVQTP